MEVKMRPFNVALVIVCVGAALASEHYRIKRGEPMRAFNVAIVIVCAITALALSLLIGGYGL